MEPGDRQVLAGKDTVGISKRTSSEQLVVYIHRKNRQDTVRNNKTLETLCFKLSPLRNCSDCQYMVIRLWYA